MPSTTITLTPGGGGTTYPITYDGNSIDVVPSSPERRLFTGIASSWGHTIDFDLLGVRYTEVNPNHMYVYMRVTLTAGTWTEPRTIISFSAALNAIGSWMNVAVFVPTMQIWADLGGVTQLSHPSNGYGISGYMVRVRVERGQTAQAGRVVSGYGTDGYSGYPNGIPSTGGSRRLVGYDSQFVFWDSPAIIYFNAPTAAPNPPEDIDLTPDTASNTHPTEYEHTEYPENIPSPPTYHFTITDDQIGALYQIEARNASAGQDWVVLNNWSSSLSLGPLPLTNIYHTWYEDDVLEFRTRAAFRNSDGSFTPSASYTVGSYVVVWSDPAPPRELRWFSPATEQFKMNELCENVSGEVLWNIPRILVDSGATFFDLDMAEHAVSLGEVRDFDAIVRDGALAVPHTIGEVYGIPYPLDYLTVRLRTGFEYTKRDDTTIYTRYSEWVVLWDGVITEDPPDPDGDYPGYVTDGPWLWLSVPRGANQPPLSEDFYRIKGMWEKEEGEDWLRISRRKVHILQEG